MTKLIEALTIFLKYADLPYPTHCEHDALLIVGIPYVVVSEEDRMRLDELGFFWSTEYDSWASLQYGSA